MAAVARILSLPIRLAGNGSLAAVEQTSDDGHGQAIAVLIGTRRGERPLAPTFGLTDPAFDTVDAAELAAQVSIFGPPVTIADAVTTYRGDGTADVVVSFD